MEKINIAQPLRHPYMLLTAVWLLAIALVNPQGDFPLNDDWSYGRSVYYLVEEGQLQFNDWAAMTLIAQVLWGAAWCELFGFSFTVLRWSTLFLGLAGLMAFHAALREVGTGKRLATGSTLLLGFNPLYLSLSFTFMTDVPFLALFLLSMLFFLRAWNSGSYWHIALGTVLAIAATLIRQFGLLAPLAFGLAWVGRERRLRAVLPALLPPLACWLALKAFVAWMEERQELPSLFGRVEDVLAGFFSVAFWENLSWRPGAFLFYWGLFLLPFCLWRGLPRLKGRAEGSLLAGVALLTILAAIITWPYLPTGNIWPGLRLGPMVLKDTYFGDNLRPVMGQQAWTGLKVIGFMGGGLLLWPLAIGIRRLFIARRLPEGSIIPTLALLAYLLYLLLYYYFFDRYHLLSLPLLMLIMASFYQPVLPRRFPYLAGGLFIMIAAFSVAATHDYLSWNRARWQLLDDLVEQQGISPRQIDGGFEFNGWYGTSPRNPLRRYGKGWWFVDEDEYAVSFGPLDCYTPFQTATFTRWLPPGRDSLRVSRRQTGISADTIFCDAESITEDRQQFVTSSPALPLGNAACRDSLQALSGKYAARLNEACEFGFTIWLEGIGPCTRLQVSAWRYGDSSPAGIVISAPQASDFYQVESQYVAARKENWEQLQLELTLPADYPSSQAVVYVWHPGGQDVWFDDIQIVWEDMD